MLNLYGDISPRTAGYAAKKLIRRAVPFMNMGRFGQQTTLPRNETNTVKWRQYSALPPSTAAMVEGVTPTGDSITYRDVTKTLAQYGRHVEISDVVLDTHEDRILMDQMERLGQTAAMTQEMICYEAIRAGTNVIYGNSVANRASVATAIATNQLNRALRNLDRNSTPLVTKKLDATDRVSTFGIPACYIAYCHPDMRNDLETLSGFRTIESYSQQAVISDSEIGTYKRIRFLTSPLYTPFLAAGASGSTLLTNGQGGGATGNADVYPVIIHGEDAWATVNLAGEDSIKPFVINPKHTDSDPYAQRGKVGFKFYSAATILADPWMMRCEAGVTQ